MMLPWLTCSKPSRMSYPFHEPQIYETPVSDAQQLKLRQFLDCCFRSQYFWDSHGQHSMVGEFWKPSAQDLEEVDCVREFKKYGMVIQISKMRVSHKMCASSIYPPLPIHKRHASRMFPTQSTMVLHFTSHQPKQGPLF